MTRLSLHSLATRVALIAGLVGTLAAPLPALAHDRDGWRDWHRPHPVYVAPAPAAYAAPYPAPYAYEPAYPAPVAYRSCNSGLVGGLIGAAAGGLLGSAAGGHGGNAAAATIFGAIGGAALGGAVGAASCDYR
jgi:hypothetical protein